MDVKGVGSAPKGVNRIEVQRGQQIKAEASKVQGSSGATSEVKNINITDQVIQTPVTPEQPSGNVQIIGEPIETPNPQQPIEGPIPTPTTPNAPSYIPTPFLPAPGYPPVIYEPYPVPVPQPYPVPIIQEPSTSQVLKYALLGAGLSLLGGIAGAAMMHFLFPPMVFPMSFCWPLIFW